MTRITWGSPGTRLFEAGTDRGVFYPQEGPGLPWNGLISVKEETTGGTPSRQHVDGTPISPRKTKTGFAAILQAFTCPQEFEEYEGSPGILTRQKRKVFGLSYRTRVGNDIQGLDHGYKIHLVYNATAMPSNVDNSTLEGGGLNATPFSWAISTEPIPVPGAKPAAHLIIDSSIAHPGAVQAVEDVLYGTQEADSRLPYPEELIDLFEQNAVLLIVDHGDGTWSAIGPDDMVYMLDDKTFAINSPTAVYLDEDTYQVSSL